MRKWRRVLVPFLLAAAMSACGTGHVMDEVPVDSLAYPSSVGESVSVWEADDAPETAVGVLGVEGIPAYSGEPYIILDGNEPGPDMPEGDAFEEYAPLDDLGRCGVAKAVLGTETMPAPGEQRGSISNVRPSGWDNRDYGSLVDGGYLYNRCHLIGWQLSAENDNEQNLVTGTRYLNVEGMLPFENLVAGYIRDTGNHVSYRVSPFYQGDSLVAYGIEMEAMSLEDDGDGILFHVFCYNVQPGIVIDYRDGSSRLEEQDAVVPDGAQVYILNTSSRKFHLPGCPSVEKMSDANRETYKGSREQLVGDGYSACGMCNP